MEILSIKQIRKYIPNCTEIRMCPKIVDCIKENKRLCPESEQPCYITYKKDELEGVIKIDFKNDIIAVHRLNEECDYAKIVRPDGLNVEFEGKETKENFKKILEELRKERQ